MGGGGRNTEPPGDQVPDDSSNQGCSYNIYTVSKQRRIGDTAADLLGYARKHQRPDEVH
ncbi:hypothetical protein D3C76_1763630 [compost metagenome]